jgi:hypothetical protein
MVKVYKLIHHDTTFADTLLAICNKDARTLFIQSELDEN